jgi:hypothetical protein
MLDNLSTADKAACSKRSVVTTLRVKAKVGEV